MTVSAQPLLLFLQPRGHRICNYNGFGSPKERTQNRTLGRGDALRVLLLRVPAHLPILWLPAVVHVTGLLFGKEDDDPAKKTPASRRKKWQWERIADETMTGWFQFNASSNMA
eukprot:scaffold239617_cov44-Attheya_sp.AAC.2